MTIPERIGVAIGVSALMVVAFTLGANAVVANSDETAQKNFLAEYDSYRADVVSAYGPFLAATSRAEKTSTMLTLSNVIDKTILHLESLEDGRECYALSRTIAVLEFEALADVIVQIRSGQPGDYAKANAANGLMTTPGFHSILNDCSEAILA